MNRVRHIFSKLPNKLDTRLATRFTNIMTKIWYSQNEGPAVTEEEIKSTLIKKFPNAKCVKVEDISGGCGAMFNIFIESSDFKGLSLVKQHKAVYETLDEQIKKIHGLHVETKAVK